MIKYVFSIVGNCDSYNITGYSNHNKYKYEYLSIIIHINNAVPILISMILMMALK